MPAVQRIQHASVPMPPGGEPEARRFYGGALGLEEVPPPIDLANLRLVWFRVGGDEAEIHCFTEDGSGPNSPGQHLCLQVDDVDSYRRRLAEHGVEIEETQEIYNRPRFFTHDPFGNRIEITQIVGAYRAS